ncbi:UAA transporter family-domain-containing protein [Aspergillus egyptiacus]|nr:UAA transporter family-domain-containing protein [Aspergillus egyptiacus]
MYNSSTNPAMIHTKSPGRGFSREDDADLGVDNYPLRYRSQHPNPTASLDSAKIEDKPTEMDGQKVLADIPLHNMSGIAATAAQTALAHWTSTFLMISLIFGGCCSNVFALEAIIQDRPSAGPLVTFAQFVLTALIMLPSFLSLSAGFRSFYIARRSVPLRSWFIYTGFFVSVNLLNNWAFAYRISVPLHIILRSGGPVASMAVGCLHAGKRYSRGQILAVALLTCGVVSSALADAQAKGQSIQIGITEDSSMSNTFVGFAILALAMLLSAFQGVYADRLYETHGRGHWKEALFYSHTLSLPLFFPTFPQLLVQWRAFASSPSLLSQVSDTIGQSASSNALLSSSETTVMEEPRSLANTFHQLLLTIEGYKPLRPFLTDIPVQVFYLVLNAITQYWCIRGVHLLSAKSSSLTVTIVLNIRKLVSLLLSIQLFGNSLSHGVLVGAALVFVGGALYGFESARLTRASPKRD